MEHLWVYKILRLKGSPAKVTGTTSQPVNLTLANSSHKFYTSMATANALHAECSRANISVGLRIKIVYKRWHVSVSLRCKKLLFVFCGVSGGRGGFGKQRNKASKLLSQHLSSLCVRFGSNLYLKCSHSVYIWYSALHFCVDMRFSFLFIHCSVIGLPKWINND